RSPTPGVSKPLKLPHHSPHLVAWQALLPVAPTVVALLGLRMMARTAVGHRASTNSVLTHNP
ncbi:MAG: hypothetical protein L0K44_11150, partial [Yaniella sp.]|nr:hypothetical protein [Yaniella sp.]